MTIDIQKVEKLLDEKKYDEVRLLIDDLAKTKLSDDEKGAALANLAMIYVDISNAINLRYRDALEEAIQGMKAINAAEMKANDNIRLTEVRSKLNQ